MTTPQTTTATTQPQKLDPAQQAVIDKITQQGDKKAIGVPNNYEVITGGQNVAPGAVASPRPVGVQYWDGDEKYPSGWDPGRILNLQHEMEDAGVYGKQRYTPGIWDATSQQAMERMMAYANQAGVSKEDIMQRWKQYAPDGDSNGAVLQVKSPEDVKAVLQATAGKVIGRSLSEGELNTLVAGYQNIDRTAQEQAAAAQASAAMGHTTTVVDAPSMDTYATNQLRSRFKPEADFVTGNQRMQEFYSILGEGGGMGGAK